MTSTVILMIGLVGGCGAAAPPPVDDADRPPRTGATVPPPPEPTRQAPGPRVAATFDERIVGEASGVAASVRNPGWVYVLDDGPGTTGVLAVDTVGGGRSMLTISGLDGRDTEGLAVGACGAGRPRTSCLYVGDIGNNQRRWESVRIWRIREPALRRRGRRPATLAGAVTTYTYAGRPADAEALLVADGRPFLVTKEPFDPRVGRSARPRLLAADSWGSGVLRDLGRIPLPAPSVGLAAAVVGNVVTGGEVGQGQVVLSTYDHVVRYDPPRPDAPLASLARWRAREVAGTPALPQPEGVAVDRCGLWMVSERVDSVWLVPSWPGGPVESEELRCPTGSARS